MRPHTVLEGELSNEKYHDTVSGTLHIDIDQAGLKIALRHDGLHLPGAHKETFSIEY